MIVEATIEKFALPHYYVLFLSKFSPNYFGIIYPQTRISDLVQVKLWI